MASTRSDEGAKVVPGAAAEEHEEKPKSGIIASVVGTLEQAKEAVMGKHRAAVTTAESDDTKPTGKMTEKGAEAADKETVAEKAGETKDAAVGKAGEYKDYVSETAKNANDVTVGKTVETKDAAVKKAEDCKDYTADKAKNVKDATMEKSKNAKDATMETAGEHMDYAGDKAKEGKGSAVGKIAELKESAADAARRAMDYMTGKTEETKTEAMKTGEAAKEKTGETMGAAKDTYEETKEIAREKMEGMKIQGEESEGASEAGTERPSGEATGGIIGAIKDKLMPKPATGKTEEIKTEAVESGEAAKEKTGETIGAAKDSYEETKEGVRVKIEGMKIQGEGSEAAGTGNERPSGEATGGIIGAIKDKLMPKPVTGEREEPETCQLRGGTGEAKVGYRLAVDEEGAPVVVKELSYVGPADDDETVVTHVRVDRTGKM